MDAHSDPDIPAFRRHATLYKRREENFVVKLSANQGILLLLRSPEVHYHVHSAPLVVAAFSHMNLVHTTYTPYSSKQGKCKVSLRLNIHHSMKYERVEVELHAFLTSELHWHTLAAYRRERAPGTHHIGLWVGPRAGLDAIKMRILLLVPAIEPQFFCRSACSLVAIPTKWYAF
jgi:hypothetical protein